MPRLDLFTSAVVGAVSLVLLTVSGHAQTHKEATVAQTAPAAPAAGKSAAIRPFTFHASDEALGDLRRRIAATKWPSRELDEIYTAPRSWTERAYPKLIHYNRLPKGGHFAAWEQAQLFTSELRAAFRPLRKSEGGAS